MVSDNSNRVHSTSTLKATKRKRKKYVKRACSTCRKAHTSCSESRPCRRCLRLGKKCDDPLPDLERQENDNVHQPQHQISRSSESTTSRSLQSSTATPASADNALHASDNGRTNSEHFFQMQHALFGNRNAPPQHDMPKKHDPIPKQPYEKPSNTNSQKYMHVITQMQYHQNMIQLHQMQLHTLIAQHCDHPYIQSLAGSTPHMESTSASDTGRRCAQEPSHDEPFVFQKSQTLTPQTGPVAFEMKSSQEDKKEDPLVQSSDDAKQANSDVFKGTTELSHAETFDDFADVEASGREFLSQLTQQHKDTFCFDDHDNSHEEALLPQLDDL